jgi:hypothetical protein
MSQSSEQLSAYLNITEQIDVLVMLYKTSRKMCWIVGIQKTKN